MCCPGEIAGECDTQELGLIYYFQGVHVREVQLGKKVIFLGSVEWEDLSLLEVDLHFICEDDKVSKLVLENGVFNR